MKSVEFARQIAAGEISPDAMHWLRCALREFLDARGKVSFEESARLTVTHRMRYRNQALIRAAEIIRASGSFSDNAVAQKIELWLEWHEQTHGKRPRESLSDLEQALLDACSSGCRPVRSARKIFDIIKSDQ